MSVEVGSLHLNSSDTTSLCDINPIAWCNHTMGAQCHRSIWIIVFMLCRLVQRLRRPEEEQDAFPCTHVDLSTLQQCLDTATNDDPEPPPMVLDLEGKSWIVQNSIEQRLRQTAATIRRDNVTVQNGTLHLAEGMHLAVTGRDVVFSQVHIIGRGANPFHGLLTVLYWIFSVPPSASRAHLPYVFAIHAMPATCMSHAYQLCSLV